MALMANLQRAKKSKPLKPSDFNPLTKRTKRQKLDTGSVVSHLMPPELAAKYAELARVKAAAKETGDFTKFNEMAAKFKC